MKKDKIFVSIASYRDPQLIPTINSLTDNAKNPQNLNIVVAWQHGDDESLKMFEDAGFVVSKIIESNNKMRFYPTVELKRNKVRLILIDIPYLSGLGACWARSLIQQLYKNEQYALYLDSHHRFVEHWDTKCVTMLEELRTDGYPKPLLTAYLPSFNPTNDPQERVNYPWELHFDRFIPEGCIFYMPAQISNETALSKPSPTRFFSGHFVFVDGTHIKEVPYDPNLFFHGEEHSMAVRSYCGGYDSFSPNKVIAWHEYTRNGRTKYWDDHTDVTKKSGQIDKHWGERNELSHKRYRILFGMDGEDPSQIDFGDYGFNGPRTVEEYEEFTGIDHRRRAVTQEVLDHKYPPGTIKRDDNWANNLTRSNDVRVLIHKSELGEIEKDYDFWYVGAHDETGKELYRKDLTRGEILNYLRNDFIDFRLIFLHNNIPSTYTVWTHSSSKGWLTKIDKPVSKNG